MWVQPALRALPAPPKVGVYVPPWASWRREKKEEEKARIKVLIVKHLTVPGGNESRVISEITDGDGTEVHFPAAH